MRGLICALFLLVSMGNVYAFEPQSQWGYNKAQTPLNRDRLTSRVSPEPWDPEWAFEVDEQTAPSRCEQLGAKACMCMMTCAAAGTLLWALVTGKIRA